MKRLTAIVLAMIMVLSLAVVTAGADGLTYAPGTVLRMATGYNSARRHPGRRRHLQHRFPEAHLGCPAGHPGRKV